MIQRRKMHGGPAYKAGGNRRRPRRMPAVTQPRLPTLLLVPALCLSSCIYVLQPSNPPYDARLRIRADEPGDYLIRVADETTNEYAVASNGEVRFQIPPLGRGCTVRLFGAIPIQDHGPHHREAVSVLRGGKIVKRLSMARIEKLPLSADGFRELDLE